MIKQKVTVVSKNENGEKESFIIYKTFKTFNNIKLKQGKINSPNYLEHKGSANYHVTDKESTER